MCRSCSTKHATLPLGFSLRPLLSHIVNVVVIIYMLGHMPVESRAITSREAGCSVLCTYMYAVLFGNTGVTSYPSMSIMCGQWTSALTDRRLDGGQNWLSPSMVAGVQPPRSTSSNTFSASWRSSSDGRMVSLVWVVDSLVEKVIPSSGAAVCVPLKPLDIKH